MAEEVDEEMVAIRVTKSMEKLLVDLAAGALVCYPTGEVATLNLSDDGDYGLLAAAVYTAQCMLENASACALWDLRLRTDEDLAMMWESGEFDPIELCSDEDLPPLLTNESESVN